MISQQEASARVSRGAAHLDRTVPGWHERIDIGRFDIASSCLCVLGQLFGGSYGAGMRILRLPVATESPDDVAITHGLFAGHGVTWHHIQDAWVAAIADRQLAQQSKAEPVAELTTV